jgi:hypothetical protein
MPIPGVAVTAACSASPAFASAEADQLAQDIRIEPAVFSLAAELLPEWQVGEK